MLAPTYDIVNCGPRQRFVANGRLVHNSEKINVQNMTRGSALRKALIAPTGYLVYVADSSNIEARMLAWHAQQEDALAVFRSGGDIYSHTAERVYHRPINKDEDPYERFIGKVLTLALGFGQGWRKFRDLMAAGPFGGAPVVLSEHEAQNLVNVYRNANYKIVHLWEQAQQAIVDMYLGNERQWGPLKIAKNMLIMPNGMTLQYPELRCNDEHGRDFEYHNGKFWTRIYGPKLIENTTQALSRIVLFDQMLRINDAMESQFDGRVVLNVHDEVIAVAPAGSAHCVYRANPDIKGDKDRWEDAELAKTTFAAMTDIMSTPPAWCADLPLAAEGGFDFSYSK